MSFRSIETALRIGVASAALYGAGCGVSKDEQQEPLATVETHISRQLPLHEFPQAEMVQRIRSGILSVHRGTQSGYEHIVPNMEGSCSGFVVRNISNTPFAVTALHCFPETVTSNSDGKIYKTTGENGVSIFTTNIKNEAGEESSGSGFRFFRGQSSAAYDLVLIDLPQETKAVGIPLNLENLSPSGTYFSVRIKNDGLYLAPMHYLDSPEEGVNRFVNLSEEEPCVPGASGSAVINSVGEVVGVMGAVADYRLTDDDIARYNLDEVHEGRIVRMCIAASATKIQDLYQDN